uniref:Uncharacterized protein n=1 Tax=viral metagenome TaxID=1070528 RepID=A0A6H1ZSU6_9ZZZZ
MPAGTVSLVERYQRLHQIKDLLDEGKEPQDIANELEIPVITVKRNIKYLSELNISDLTPEKIGAKRAEIELELIGAAEEAKKLFDDAKLEIDSITTRRFFVSWLEAIKLRMQLYGLDNYKIENLTQINQFNQYREPDRISSSIKEKIANAIIDGHENRKKV